MIEFPNAKINLGLHVIRKRPDGFHDIETVFYPIPLCDTLEVVENEGYESDLEKKSRLSLFPSAEIGLASGKKVHFSTSGISVDGNISGNLCIRACRLFDEKFSLPFDISMHLQKNIPMGAGLGGGSSDGAFVLKILNQLSGNKATTEDLVSMATELGSDCAFFLFNKPAMAEGKGEVLSLLPVDLSGYFLVIVKPQVHVSTADAYSGVKISGVKGKLKDITLLKPEQWQGKMVNDFEYSIFEKYPAISEIRNKLILAGATYAAMSGSGSSVFAIFKSQVRLQHEFQGCFYFSKILE